LAASAGSRVEVRGWIVHLRSSGKIRFLQVRDGTGIVQAVAVRGEVPDAVFDALAGLPQESSVVIRGVVREEPRAPGGAELVLEDVVVLHRAESYPITPKEHGPAFLLEHRHLWLRSRRQAAILRVRDAVIGALRDYLRRKDFVCVDSPIFTPSACEGTTTLFGVDYFGGKAYLTQSGQLYAEAAAMALGRVYCFGPTFRAEKSKTRRHLTEFWMLEPELAFATLEDVMDLAEGMLADVVERVLETRREELRVLERDVARLEAVKPPFPRISYAEAAGLLREAGLPFEEGNDFGAPEEEAISRRHDRPVMVHRYPHAVKAFYMKRDPADPTKALCVDVLAPEGYGEIIGGSQREEDYEVLLARLSEHGLPREAFEWYLDLRRYGSVPHGGFGLGLERTVAWICGVEHLRECIPFPRMLYRIYP
jgi:asparaginyl-tRNA synthetase